MVTIMDLVSRKWLTEIVSVEETSLQVAQAFTDALRLENLDEAVTAYQDALVDPGVDDSVHPILLVVSDNGPQMTSMSTRAFMALNAIGQHFGRPGTPTDQAWIETLFGHIKAEWPHLLMIRDPAVLRAELAVVRAHYNEVRLHAGVGYVTPNDEHEGRGPAIRKARQAGLENARQRRLAFHRRARQDRPAPGPAMLSNPSRISITNSKTRQEDLVRRGTWPTCAEGRGRLPRPSRSRCGSRVAMAVRRDPRGPPRPPPTARRRLRVRERHIPDSGWTISLASRRCCCQTVCTASASRRRARLT